jgi:hypothetical protein
MDLGSVGRNLELELGLLASKGREARYFDEICKQRLKVPRILADA